MKIGEGAVHSPESVETTRRTFLAGTGVAAALLIAAAAGCAPTPVVPKPNLLTNGSFEVDGFGTAISGWTVTR
jgi:hypothetical protein